MPAKYHIHVEPTPPRLRPVGRLGIVDWREDCSSCHNCVKRGCVYGFYRDEADRLHDEVGYLDYVFQCKGCLTCVQNCTKGILTRVVNPEYEQLGDAYYTPEIVLSTWYQADTGKIPVSGSGYGGRFSGEGFDSMWTDMSEIVRPTRDGIHGREYINISVDIGRKLQHLAFQDGKLAVEPPPLLENPFPGIFDVIPTNFHRGQTMPAIVAAAADIGTLTVIDMANPPDGVDVEQGRIVPLIHDADMITDSVSAAPMVMVSDGPDAASFCDQLKAKNSRQIVAFRVPATPIAADRVLELAKDGAEVVHLVFDKHGREAADSNPRHMRDVLRDVHGTLVKNQLRDQVTLSATGGIALPEHMAKALICGADFVGIDLPLLIALECRLCGECERDEVCPIALHEADLEYATQRIVNLMGAWCNQLIELLGAMGIREARRLRGETGRSMFFEDLEANTFGRLFGKRKAQPIE